MHSVIFFYCTASQTAAYRQAFMKSRMITSVCVARKKRNTIMPLSGVAMEANQKTAATNAALISNTASTVPYESQNLSLSALKPAPSALKVVCEPVAATHLRDAVFPQRLYYLSNSFRYVQPHLAQYG